MKQSLIGIMAILLWVTACSSPQENGRSGIESETIANELGNAPIEQLSFYLQRDSTDFYLEDLVVTLSDDATILDR